MRKKPLIPGDKILVLTEEWHKTTTYIRWFPNDPCLAQTPTSHVQRRRLEKLACTSILACKDAIPIEVTLCVVI